MDFLQSFVFERNQFLNQKPINVIDCIKAVDGEVRVPRVDSLKRHILKRFQKVNSFESSILKNLSEKVSILYPNIIYLSIIFPNNVILSTIDIWFVYQDTYFVSCSLPLLPSIWFVFLGMLYACVY
jgi:hypothetical protein